jgi:hypothetical protein
MRAKARDRKVAAIWTALMLAHLFAAAPARAEQESGLAYSRDASHSAIKLAYAESRGASDPGIGPAEWIDPSTLVTYEEDENGEVLRAGARTATRRCGALELRIAGGYLNHGTNGEQGAVDDFAIVEIRVQDGASSGQFAIGPCDASLGRYGVLAECFSNWATSLFASRHTEDGCAGLWISITHHYEEFRQIRGGPPEQAR